MNEGRRSRNHEDDGSGVVPEYLSAPPKLHTVVLVVRLLALVAVASTVLLPSWAGAKPDGQSAVVVLRPAEEPGQAYVAVAGVGDSGSWIMSIDGPLTPGRRVPVALLGECRCEPHQVREGTAIGGWRRNLFVFLGAVVISLTVMAWRRRRVEQRAFQASVDVATSGRTTPVRLRANWFESAGRDLLGLEVLAADEDRTLGWVDACLVPGRFDPSALVRMLGTGAVGAPVALSCSDGCHWLLANGPLRAAPFPGRRVHQPHVRSGDVNRLLGWAAPTAAPVVGSTTRLHVNELPIGTLDPALVAELKRSMATAAISVGSLLLMGVVVAFAVRSEWSLDLVLLACLTAWGIPPVAIRLALRRRFDLLERRLRASMSGVDDDAAWMVRALAFGVVVDRGKAPR